MKNRKIALACAAACGLVSLAVWAAVPSTWTADTDLECVGDGTACAGAGVTGWDADIDVVFDSLSGTGTPGDVVGGIPALTVHSKLYGDFTATGTLALTGAAAYGCDGYWAATVPDGIYLKSVDGWDGIGAEKWSWKIDGTVFCLQDDMVARGGRRLIVSLTPSSQLGTLWGLTGGLVTEPTPNSALTLRWGGLASVNGDTFQASSWDASAAQQGSTQGATAYLTAGGNSIADLRNRIRINIASITRGLTFSSGTAGMDIRDLDADAPLSADAGAGWNPTQQILFYDFTGMSGSCIDGNCGKTVTLKGGTPFASSFMKATVSGRKTVIVRGGNLRIAADMAYNDPDSDLVAIVVLRDETDPKNGGNIYVDPKVTNLAGTFVLDGSLVNFSGSVLSSKNPADLSLLRRQLYLFGSLASANTVGGAALAVPVCPYGSDAEKAGLCPDDVTAAKYDLAEMRSLYIASSNSGGLALTPGAPADSADCAEVPGREILRWSNAAGTWDAQTYGWAGKRECFPTGTGSSALAGLLIPSVPSLRRSSMAVEFNPLALSAPLPIMLEQ